MSSKIYRRIKKNYLFLSFFAVVALVGIIVVFKLFLTSPQYIYTKVKLGQGYWWASTLRPSIWFTEAINKGDVARDFIGNVDAEVLDRKQYPYFGGDQFDIYIDLKLKVSKGKNGYSFNRDFLAVGSPIEIQFPDSDIAGTVVELSEKPFSDKLVKKRITLTKKYSQPWEFDAIKVGDSYSDGENTIFKVVDKRIDSNSGLLSVSTQFSAQGQSLLEPANSISVAADVLVKEVKGRWVMGVDQIIYPGKNINISTSNFLFDNYTIVNVE